MSSKEDAEKRGIYLSPVKPNGKRRAPFHDYARPGMYLITVVTETRRPLLGTLIHDNHPYVNPSPLGAAIRDIAAAHIADRYPNARIRKLCIMPDHLHFILDVVADFPPGKKLGNLMGTFKTCCTRLANSLGVQGSLFEEGFNDRILLESNQWQRWARYLDDNPRRLALRRENPELFTVSDEIDLMGRTCRILGNRFLLDVPDEAAVVFHRAYTPREWEELTARMLECGKRGGVLVGASIHPCEKAVMREAMNRGYRIIILRENGFPPLYKPSGEHFDACVQGLLLNISPHPHNPLQKDISRDGCLDLNALAEKLAYAYAYAPAKSP